MTERDRLFAWIAENARVWFDGRSSVAEESRLVRLGHLKQAPDALSVRRHPPEHVDLIRGGGSPSSEGSVVDDAAFDMIEVGAAGSHRWHQLPRSHRQNGFRFK